MIRMSPLAAVCGGIAAGLVGCLAQDVFFAWTRRLMPPARAGAFEPPEPEQADETPTQTIARRVVEDLVHRGPLVHKERAGRLVHYAFGAAWGGIYGVVAGTLPMLATLKGGVAFGLVVWATSDDFLLPGFRVAGWPHRYPVETHLYAIAAHAVFGAALSVSFVGLGRAVTPVASLLGSLYVTRNLPRWLRPPVRKLTRRGLELALPLREAASALNGTPRLALL